MRYFRTFQMMWYVFAMTLVPFQISAQPKDLKGWDKARWGMTEREIEKAFRGKVKQRSEPIKDRQEGIYVNLEIPDLSFANTKFTANFVMDDKTDQLTEVVLRPKGVHFRMLFEILESKLVAKYGPETYRDKEDIDMKKLSKNGYGEEQMSRIWRFPSTTVTLEYWVYGMGSGEVSDGVTLIYKKNLKSAGKR